MRIPLPLRDSQLIQIVDAALHDAERRSGNWLVCKPGCTSCCVGVFAIDQLDLLRLQQGLAALEAADPERVARVRRRARQSWTRLAANFPGDVQTGVLGDNDGAAKKFEDYANMEPCPALDPGSGTCDLYAWRPITCRVFGPPVRSEGGLGVCELCYYGASTDQIAACEMSLQEADALQAQLDSELENAGCRGKTIVAFALAEPAVA